MERRYVKRRSNSKAPDNARPQNAGRFSVPQSNSGADFECQALVRLRVDAEDELMLVAALEAALRLDSPRGSPFHLRTEANCVTGMRSFGATVIRSKIDHKLTLADGTRSDQPRCQRISVVMARELVLRRCGELP